MSAREKLFAIQAAEEAIRAIPVDDETMSHRNQALWAMVALGDEITMRMHPEKRERPVEPVARSARRDDSRITPSILRSRGRL